MSEEDPYRPPESRDGTGRDPKSGLREIVIGWEKLRPIYNLVLLFPGLVVMFLWTGLQEMPWAAAVTGAVFVVIGANVAFFLGPLAELYVRGLLRDGEPIGNGRWLIFSAGLVVSAGVFLLALIGAFGG